MCIRDRLYNLAVKLIEQGLAYVDDSSAEEIAALKGTPTEPGKESPFRSRSIEENLSLFARMRNGEFKDGEKVLRAKIDMASPNMHLRDPLMYRIKHAHHHRTGDKLSLIHIYESFLSIILHPSGIIKPILNYGNTGTTIGSVAEE